MANKNANLIGRLASIIGLAAALVGTVASATSDWANEQKMNAEIDRKVNEAISKKEESEEEES